MNQLVLKNDDGQNSQRNLAPFSSALSEVPEVAIWLANCKSERTRQTYRNAISDCMAFLGLENPDDLLQLEQVHLIAWRHELDHRGVSPRTINNRLSALSSLFKHLYDKQLVSKNPVEGVKRLEVDAKTTETPALSRSHVRDLLNAPDRETLRGARDAALMHVFAYTGCRVSEPTRLRVRDFHMDQDYWVLDFTVKGGKRNRLAIHTELQIALRRYLAMAGHENQKEAYIFQACRQRPNYSGQPITRQQVDRIFRKYARQVGIAGNFTVHSFRATFITEALERDHPIDAVQKSVGHASMTTTQAYDKRGFNPRKSASFAVNY